MTRIDGILAAAEYLLSVERRKYTRILWLIMIAAVITGAVIVEVILHAGGIA